MSDLPSPPAPATAPHLSSSLAEDFSRVDTWIFDLDNTLYPESCRLFDQIDERMGQYVARFLNVGRDEARRIQKAYYRQYGATMNGMMLHHQMDPEPYLHYVHDIDHSPVRAAPLLARAIEALPGRKLVFTNGSQSHAERVMRRLGVSDLFEHIHDIKASGYTPKPAREAYDALIDSAAVQPQRSAMFEDIARNLEAPHAMGMKTVLVRTDPATHPDACAFSLGSGDEPYVDHATDNLSDFLLALARR